MTQAITASTATRDGSVSFAFYSAQTANTINYNAEQDEKIVIIVRNENDSASVNTATITVSPGDYWRHDLGTLTLDVADGNTMTQIGPLDSARFKGSNGLITINVSVTQSGTVSSVKLGVVNLP
jgi:hypothetical protein